MIIRPNPRTNHGVVDTEPIKHTCNGVGTDESVPQEGSAGICNAALEEKKGSGRVSIGGILEDERGAEGDTARKEAVENGEGVELLGLEKGV